MKTINLLAVTAAAVLTTTGAFAETNLTAETALSDKLDGQAANP